MTFHSLFFAGGKGHYMFIEASSPATVGNKAWMISRQMNYQRACLHFWYHMHGSDIGYLNIYQLDRRGILAMQSLWQKSGKWQ